MKIKIITLRSVARRARRTKHYSSAPVAKYLYELRKAKKSEKIWKFDLGVKAFNANLQSSKEDEYIFEGEYVEKPEKH